MSETNPVDKPFPWKTAIPAFIVGAIIYRVLYYYFQTIIQPLVNPVCTASVVVTVSFCTFRLIDAMDRSSAQLKATFSNKLAELERGDETQELVH